MSAAKERLMMSVDGYFALEDASPGIRYEYLDGYAYLRSDGSVNQVLEAISLDHRYEYLDGHLTMMPGTSRNHSRIGLDIAAFLMRSIHNSSCEVFNSDARVKLDNARYVYPDVSVSCAKQPEDDVQTVIDPTVVAEVLSPGTIDYDRGEKLQRYRECPSLQAILLVFQDQPLVEVYRRQSEKVWTVQTYGMDDQIVLDAIGVTIPVAEIYRRVTFAN